jgi:hypothetical protein
MNGSEAIDLTTHDVEAKALAFPDQARAIRVTDRDTMAQANDLLMDIKALRKEVQDTFRPLADKAHAAHKAILEQQKKAEAPLIEAENIIKPAIRAYMDEIERKRREEEARLRREALLIEEERRLQEALEAEAEGNKAEAEAIISEPVFVPTPTVKADIPKVDMRNFRKVWKARVTDFSAFARYCAANPQYLHLLLENTAALNQMARALKNNMNIPGVVVTEE